MNSIRKTFPLSLFLLLCFYCKPVAISFDCSEAIRMLNTNITTSLIMDIKTANAHGDGDTLRKLYPTIEKYWNSDISNAESAILSSLPDLIQISHQIKKTTVISNNWLSNDTCIFFLKTITLSKFPPGYDPKEDPDTDRQLAYYQALNRTADPYTENINYQCISSPQFSSMIHLKRLPKSFEACLADKN